MTQRVSLIYIYIYINAMAFVLSFIALIHIYRSEYLEFQSQILTTKYANVRRLNGFIITVVELQ